MFKNCSLEIISGRLTICYGLWRATTPKCTPLQLTHLDMTQTGALEHRRCCQLSTCIRRSINVEKWRSTLYRSSSDEGQHLTWNIWTYFGDTSAPPLFANVCRDISVCCETHHTALVLYLHGVRQVYLFIYVIFYSFTLGRLRPML